MYPGKQAHYVYYLINFQKLNIPLSSTPTNLPLLFPSLPQSVTTVLTSSFTDWFCLQKHPVAYSVYRCPVIYLTNSLFLDTQFAAHFSPHYKTGYNEQPFIKTLVSISDQLLGINSWTHFYQVKQCECFIASDKHHFIAFPNVLTFIKG